VSEVVDWEAGGRTSPTDVTRIFDREAESGPMQVTALLRTGTKGVCYAKALDRCETYPTLPEYSDDRRRGCLWGEVHASTLALLQGKFDAELVDESVLDIAAREEDDERLRKSEAKRQARLSARCTAVALACIVCPAAVARHAAAASAPELLGR
jgi:hypothetical protein